jgi:hypothetical protein
MYKEKRRRQDNGSRIEGERQEKERWRFGRKREEDKCACLFLF